MMEPIEYAEAVDESNEGNADAWRSDKSFLEQLLSPLMLQRMMSCGGALLVLGFVGWLWSTGVFEEPLVAATAIGCGTLAVMGLGMGMVRNSRYQLAGSGLTLLASLAMPLSLWFYDAQKLITLANGGHLWIPAAIICAIYGFIARTLRKPIFVYTLVGGVVMTGMLFLADQSVNRFWQLLPLVSFLLGVGWLSFFAERLFPDSESDFSRTKFGYAFRYSGIAVMVGGFVMLLAGQLAGRVAPLFSLSGIPLVATSGPHKLWAIGVLLGSASGFAIDRILNRNARLSTAAAIALLVWSGLTLLDFFSIQLQLTHFTIAAGIYTMGSWWFADFGDDAGKTKPIGITMLAPFLALSFATVLQFAAQFVVSGGHLVFSTSGPMVVANMYVMAAVSYVGWHKMVGLNSSRPAYLYSCSVFGVLALYSVAAAQVLTSFDLIAALVLTVPTTFVAIGLIFAKPDNTTDWQRSAIGATWFVLVSLLLTSLEIAPVNVHAAVCWVSAVAAIILIAGAVGRPWSVTSWLSYLVATVSVSQLLCMNGVSLDYALVLSTTAAGTVLSTVGFVFRSKDDRKATGLVAMADQFAESGNGLVIFGTIAGTLLAANRLLAQETTHGLLAVIGFQLVAIAAGSLLSANPTWRLAFRAAAMVNVLMGILVFNSFLNTHWLQRVELAAVLCGSALLVIGHLAWYREGEQRDESATAALWCGSLLVGIPLSAGLLFYRSHEVNSIWNWWFFHESTSIVAALLLLGAGMACRIRSTTISGASMLTVYMVSLLALVQWPGQLKNVSVLMMAGGGVFFLLAVLLSMYRDRLLSLPNDIRTGRGVFRVLRWR